MSAIYSGQIQECVKTWQNYILFILSNNNCVKSQAFFHGHTKILISRTCAPLSYLQCSIVFGDIRVKDFTCNTFLIEVNDKFLSVLH